MSKVHRISKISKYISDNFIYCRESGIVIRKIDSGGQSKAGCIVGSLDSKGKYIRVKIKGKTYLLHRIIWFIEYNEEPNGVIDHINHNGLDNRIENLRLVDNLTNAKNMPLSSRNSSGVIGVCFRIQNNRWEANIKVDGNSIYLGSFSKFSDAVDARKNAEVLYGFHENHGGIK